MTPNEMSLLNDVLSSLAQEKRFADKIGDRERSERCKRALSTGRALRKHAGAVFSHRMQGSV